jgi:hypothetical protein
MRMTQLSLNRLLGAEIYLSDCVGLLLSILPGLKTLGIQRYEVGPANGFYANVFVIHHEILIETSRGKFKLQCKDGIILRGRSPFYQC